MGPEGLEPSTPVLSGLCSNQLSYGPEAFLYCAHSEIILNQSAYAHFVRYGGPAGIHQDVGGLSYGPEFKCIVTFTV